MQVIKAAREALDEEGLQDVAVVAGVGCASTRETISVAQASAEAGADAVMVVAPSYYSGFLISNGEALVQFFLDVADASPVPVYVCATLKPVSMLTLATACCTTFLRLPAASI